MRLVLIGDIHVYRLFVPPWALLSKRLLGQLNLWFSRRARFRRELLAPVLERVAQLRPDMILLSGDLTTTAVHNEFRDIAAALDTLGKEARIIAVPGNHDRYTFNAARRRRFEHHLTRMVPATYPALLELAPKWRLLAIDATVPRFLTARGRLDASQLATIQQHLRACRPDEGLVVLCHYPFAVPAEARAHWKWDHQLEGADALRDALRSCPARIVYLHGHIHQPWCWQPLETPRVTAINAGAPCMVTMQYPRGQGFWEIQIPPEGQAPVAITHHVPAADKTAARNSPAISPPILRWTAQQVL